MKALLTLMVTCMLLPRAVSGLSCYTCNPTKCEKFTEQNCTQGFDRCLTASATLDKKFTLKVCAKKATCDVPQGAVQGVSVENVQCCEGNLCNGAESFTLSFLLIFIPLLSSILFY